MKIERITLNPAVMGGKPCVRGLRVTVGTILGFLAGGKSRERVLEAYPSLEPEDIDARGGKGGICPSAIGCPRPGRPKTSARPLPIPHEKEDASKEKPIDSGSFYLLDRAAGQ